MAPSAEAEAPPPGLSASVAQHPFIYEINTWAWLNSISSAEGRSVDLSSVPARHWDELVGLGFEAVWLMGVWQRSPAGIEIALANADLRASFRDALPDWRTEDVVGSPYCVRDYVVDEQLGGPAGLADARAALAARGIRLILDFVPNHVAPDHPWTIEQPGHFVAGTAAELAADPASFVNVGGRVLANGRDPSSRPGRMSCSSTPSTQVCGRRPCRRSDPSPNSATACGATWPC